MAKKTNLVYSTDQGRVCPGCARAVAECECSRLKAQSIASGDGIVRVSRETKGRKGKGVTLITGLPLTADELKKFGKELKAKCRTEGLLNGGVIEIQGDHCDFLLEALKKKGWQVKRSGG